MAKNIRRMLAMVLVMCMFVSALPMQALAAEGDGVVTEGPTPDANGDMVTTTTTTSTDSTTGHTTVTVDIHKEVSSSDSSTGTVVTGTKDSSSTTIQYKDDEGTVVREDKVAESTSSYIVTETTNESGSSSHYVAEGKDWSKESMDIPEGGVNVDVPLTEGSSNSETFGDDVSEEPKLIDGKKPGAGDTNYEYTETTVLEQGKVTVTTTNVTSANGESSKTDMDYVNSETAPDGTNDLIKENESLAPDQYLPGSNPEGATVPTEGNGDYVYVGTGNTSQLRPAIVYNRPMDNKEKVEQFGNEAYIKATDTYASYYVNWLNAEARASVAKDANGNYVTDEDGYILNKDGERVIKEEQTATGLNGETIYLHRFDLTGTNHKIEGWYTEGEGEQEGSWSTPLNGNTQYKSIYATAQQFILVDKDTGEVITTYCADVNTKTQKGYGYTMVNLEDSTYYSEEQAEMIRSIAQNGYWGIVGNKLNEDGTEMLDEAGNPIPKDGSLAALKAQLLASNKFTDEELTALTDGVALTATQMAIWAFSNEMHGVEFVNTHYVLPYILNPEYGIDPNAPEYILDPTKTSTDLSGQTALGNVPADKEKEALLLFRIYEYLTSLAPTPAKTENAAPTTADTIITNKNFLESMSITVIEKADGHENNNDYDNTNDAYSTRLTFALVVEPSTENGDSLEVTVLAADGTTVLASGRIAGEGTLLPKDENGNFYFENVTLIEGEQNVKLNLSGIQHLKEGVYLYTSEIKEADGQNVSSQTLVGLAGGNHGVNVTMDITFELKVDGIVATEHVYHYEGDPSTPPRPPRTPRTPPEPPTPNNPPQIFRLNNDDLEEIPEEPVPLATPVVTGDNSFLWIAVVLLSLSCMVAVNIFDKKNQHEAF